MFRLQLCKSKRRDRHKQKNKNAKDNHRVVPNIELCGNLVAAEQWRNCPATASGYTTLNTALLIKPIATRALAVVLIYI